MNHNKNYLNMSGQISGKNVITIYFQTTMIREKNHISAIILHRIIQSLLDIMHSTTQLGALSKRDASNAYPVYFE